MLWEDNYLAHHGIVGQKWGVRRFQNKDGTLTDEGKKRYGKDADSRDPKEIARTSKLVGESTNRDWEFERSANDAAFDKGIRKQLYNIISKSNNFRIRSAVDVANAYKNSCEQLDNAFKEFDKKLHEETGKKWDGDGTELHYALKKKYPEYEEISDNNERLYNKLINASIKLSSDEEFSNIKGMDKYKHFYDSFPEYGDWYKTGDQRAFAIARTLVSGKDIKNEDPYLVPEYFIESYDSKGNKLRSPYFDDKVIEKNYNDFKQSGKEKGGLLSWNKKAAKDGTLYDKLDDLYDLFDDKHGKLLDEWWNEREKVRGKSLSEENAFQDKYAKEMAKQLDIPPSKDNLFVLKEWFFTWDD